MAFASHNTYGILMAFHHKLVCVLVGICLYKRSGVKAGIWL